MLRIAYFELIVNERDGLTATSKAVAATSEIYAGLE